MIRNRIFPSFDVIVFIGVSLLVCCAGSAIAQPPPSVPASERIGDYKDLSKEQKAMLDDVEKRTFEWFRDSENPKIGITPDHWDGGSGGEGDYFASIASSGFGLTAYGIARRTRLDETRRGRATHADDTAFLPRRAAKRRCRRHRRSRLFLPLPRHANRPPLRTENVGRTFHHRHDAAARRRAVRRVVLRQEHEGRKRNPPARRRDLSTRRLGVGDAAPTPRRDGLDAGSQLHPRRLARL